MPPLSQPNQSFSARFSQRRGDRIGLLPFVPAGYPDLATTAATVKAVDAAGASAIEIGFPFTDPIADGATIQQAYTAALAKKIKIADIFQTVRDIAPALSAPLVGMVSYSIVYRAGAKKFFADARAAGFAAMLIPDLPPPEARQTCDQIRAAGLDTVLLIAPTTAESRRKEIADLCSAFVYYLSVSGITGARADLPPDVATNVRQIKSLASCPVCVGFGISKPQHLAQLTGVADGAIVGSAIVKLMTQALDQGPQSIAGQIGQYCKDLIAPPR
jgi:tryptophan synthase alpha chain